jgi:integrase
VDGMAFVVRGGKRGEGQQEKRQPFSADHLKTLFASPLYTGCASAIRRATSGESVVKDALWWVFPLTLYSGMRIEEAMGLRAQDVREVGGVLSFVVEPRPDRPLKTASSRRLIPVHPELTRLGLMDRVNGNSGLLFPELRPDAKHGTYTSALSKKAGRYLRAIGLPATVTTHSTRHAFTDALRRAKVEPEIRSRLLGHSARASMTERYGAGHDVKALQEAVNAVTYPTTA